MRSVKGGGFRWLCLGGYVIGGLLEGGGMTASWRILLSGLWLIGCVKSGVRQGGIDVLVIGEVHHPCPSFPEGAWPDCQLVLFDGDDGYQLRMRTKKGLCMVFGN